MAEYDDGERVTTGKVDMSEPGDEQFVPQTDIEAMWHHEIKGGMSAAQEGSESERVTTGSEPRRWTLVRFMTPSGRSTWLVGGEHEPSSEIKAVERVEVVERGHDEQTEQYPALQAKLREGLDPKLPDPAKRTLRDPDDDEWRYTEEKATPWQADERTVRAVVEAIREDTNFYAGLVAGSEEKGEGYALGFYEAADFVAERFNLKGDTNSDNV